MFRLGRLQRWVFYKQISEVLSQRKGGAKFNLLVCQAEVCVPIFQKIMFYANWLKSHQGDRDLLSTHLSP